MSMLIIFITTFFGGWIFPWWWPLVAGYAVGLWKPKTSVNAFMAGFIGTALAWFIPSCYQDFLNHHLLSKRIALLFHLPGSVSLLAVTLLLGGLLGGMGAWAGFALRHKIKPHPTRV